MTPEVACVFALSRFPCKTESKVLGNREFEKPHRLVATC